MEVSTNIRQPLAVLFSEQSREVYVKTAREKGATYTFTDAWGNRKTWLKGEYAYLAPNAACAVLNRFNLKHDLINEEALVDRRLCGYRAIVIPNATVLSHQTIGEIQRWLEEDDGHLLVTGKTNLPGHMLGLEDRMEIFPEGYTGWRWSPGTPFSDLRAWERDTITGYEGFTANRVVVTPKARVPAELFEYLGNISCADTAEKRRIGPAVVLTPNSVYIANQVFEFLGGMMQGHLNIEPIRYWANPFHWGDAVVLFLRHLMQEVGLWPLWRTRLRSFGTHDGVLSFRHDVHGHFEFGMLDYEIQNLVPATYDIEDPDVSTTTQPHQAARWVERVSSNNFIEPALHNDSKEGDPPTGVYGTHLHELVTRAEENLGFPVYTCGRHGGGHMHPETLDAMDYLYAHNDRIRGLCTFSFYHMLEYGVRNPDVVKLERNLTYASSPYPTVAATGFWFPFQPAVTTDKEWRILRGWDRTHASDCDYDTLDAILNGHSARIPISGDRLENGVYAIQFHPQFTTDPAENNGQGTLGYVRYAINLAERKNYWIASQKDLYQRLQDYRDLLFHVAEDGSVTLYNPTDRGILGMVLEQKMAFGSVWDDDTELIHVVNDCFITIPPIRPRERKTLRFKTDRTQAPRILQSGTKGIAILDARYRAQDRSIHLRVRVCREQRLQISNTTEGACYLVSIESEKPYEVHSVVRGITDATIHVDAGYFVPFIRITVQGDENHFMEKDIVITRID
jgi:hypothetical protein